MQMPRLPSLHSVFSRRSPARVSVAASIEVRWAEAGDGPALERVAALDERPLPGGPLLVAEVDGALWAARALGSGDAVSDPFVPAADAVELLRLRAAQIAAAGASHPGLWSGWRRDRASATVGA